MKSPQPRDFMECAVKPVLHQIGKKHDLDELQEERLAGDRFAKPASPRGALEHRQRRCQRQVSKGLDEQARDEKVK